MTKNIKRDVRVVLRSSNATSVNNGTYTYNVDWSAILEDEPYLMSFSFITEAYTIGTNTTSGILSVNIGGSNTTDLSSMRTGATTGTTTIPPTSALFSPVLGITVVPRGSSGAGGIMMSKATFNPHHYLERRPYSNTFNLSMRNVNVTSNNSPGTAVNHLIILHFKPANKNLKRI
jgi:hypothetical protein